MKYHYRVVRIADPTDIPYTSEGRIPYHTRAAAYAMGKAMTEAAYCSPDTHRAVVVPVESAAQLPIKHKKAMLSQGIKPLPLNQLGNQP